MTTQYDKQICDRCGTNKYKDELIYENMCAEGNIGYDADCCKRYICRRLCEFVCHNCKKIIIDINDNNRVAEINSNECLPTHNIDIIKHVLKLTDDGGYYNNTDTETNNKTIFVCNDCYQKKYYTYKTYSINHFNGLTFEEWNKRYS